MSSVVNYHDAADGLCFNLKHSLLLSWLLQIAGMLSDMIITLLNNFG